MRTLLLTGADRDARRGLDGATPLHQVCFCLFNTSVTTTTVSDRVFSKRCLFFFISINQQQSSGGPVQGSSRGNNIELYIYIFDSTVNSNTPPGTFLYLYYYDHIDSETAFFPNVCLCFYDSTGNSINFMLFTMYLDEYRENVFS